MAHESSNLCVCPHGTCRSIVCCLLSAWIGQSFLFHVSTHIIVIVIVIALQYRHERVKW